jgi:hypothetical protein
MRCIGCHANIAAGRPELQRALSQGVQRNGASARSARTSIIRYVAAAFFPNNDLTIPTKLWKLSGNSRNTCRKLRNNKAVNPVL